VCHSLLADASFWRQLQRLDEQVAAEVRSAGCPHCQGVLHGARYPRKVYGVSRALLGEGYDSRPSFCCAREGCRRRTTPASVRFLGRRCFPGALVLLACALTQELSRRRRAALGARLGVSERTLARWRHWWRCTLPATPWWHVARSRFVPPPHSQALPSSLLARFGVLDNAQALIAALHFLTPCSLTSFASRPEQAA
jgi:hypothetical protein